MQKAIYFLVVILCTQCKMGTNKPGTGELAVIDCSIKYPEKKVYLQDIADVEYIPLETNNNSLISSGARIIHVSDNYIVAVHKSKGDVFIFDGKGKLKSSFNHRGKSGTEYNAIHSIAFDEKGKEIFIFDRVSVNPKFLVYGEDGEFKRTLESLPDFQPQAYNFDDATLLTYNEYGLYVDKYSGKPYIFLSKKDGKVIDTLDISLPSRISTRFFFPVEVDGKTYTTSLNLVISSNLSYGKNFIIADLSSDTIYKLTPQKKLIPLMVRKPPVQSTDPKIVIANTLMTDKFIIFTKGVLDIELAKKTNQFSTTELMYDFTTGQMNEINLVNKDIEPLNIGFEQAMTPENVGIGLIDITSLFEADEAGKVQGKLKQIMSSLHEEDNPILMKVKF